MNKCGEFERVFLYMDQNGDGKISPSELRNRLSLMGDGEVLLQEVEVAIESLDKDGDGLLDMEDLVGLIEDGGDEEKLNDLKEAFHLYDDDNCGFITPEDLKRTLSRLGESKSVDECRFMINHFDLNGDGVICFDEFRAMMQQ